MADRKYFGTLVSHTHSDRAWYVPFEVFRIRLVRLIDRLIELLDRDPAYRSFMLDGQVLPIEDYLAIRPERCGDLERLVRGGRLVMGLWYALADEYLVSPEALICNLSIGTRTAEALGGCMREGYVPDSFGHIAPHCDDPIGVPPNREAWLGELGPDVTHHGGPTAMVLRDGSREDVRVETRRILDSGVCDGGRFVLREANNLAPRTPVANLSVMYETVRAWRGYHD